MTSLGNHFARLDSLPSDRVTGNQTRWRIQVWGCWGLGMLAFILGRWKHLFLILSFWAPTPTIGWFTISTNENNHGQPHHREYKVGSSCQENTVDNTCKGSFVAVGYIYFWGGFTMDLAYHLLNDSRYHQVWHRAQSGNHRANKQ